MNTIRLFAFGDPGWASMNRAAVAPWIAEAGTLDRALGAKPWAAADTVGIDEGLDRGWASFCVSRALGSTDEPRVIGKGCDGEPVACEPRGPEAYSDVIGVVPDWVPAWAKRTARSRKMGGVSIAYIGGVPQFPSTLTAAKRKQRIRELLAPIVDAGFTHIGLDAVSAVVYTPGVNRKPTSLDFAEEALRQNVGVLTECCRVVDPRLFCWFNGRFGCISAPDTWRLAATEPGWFGPGCRGAVTEHILWIQGSEKSEARVELVQRWPGMKHIVETAGMSREQLAAIGLG